MPPLSPGSKHIVLLLRNNVDIGVYKEIGSVPANFFENNWWIILLTGEKIGKNILLIDSNEDMANGKLARKLKAAPLEMLDAVKLRSAAPGPPTFVRGSRQIDAAWVTPDVDITKACFLPFYFEIGDRRGIVIDIPRQSLVGGNLKSIHCPTARRLKCDKMVV